MNGEWIIQLNVVSCGCSNCGSFIHPGIIYMRWSVNPDGLDEYGKDYCPKCYNKQFPTGAKKSK